jgi:hypothetical protein
MPVLSRILWFTHLGAAAVAFAGPKGGRRISPAGQKDMDLIAGRVECSLPSFGL